MRLSCAQPINILSHGGRFLTLHNIALYAALEVTDVEYRSATPSKIGPLAPVKPVAYEMWGF